jgi:acetyl-CoA acyltransferase
MAAQTPVIAGAVRTPQGKEDGVFRDRRPEDLSIPLIEEVMDQTGLASEQIDDVMWGCAQTREEQATNIARQIAIFALGEGVPGTTVDRQCASSATTIMMAADAVAAGRRDAIFAGGVENMSMVKMGEGAGKLYPEMYERYGAENLPMGATAEKVAEQHDVSREEQDEYGARSQQRANEATEEGRFDEEIVPITGKDDEGEEILVEEDQGLRPGTTTEKLAELPTVFKEDGTVTPGNASQISDGASCVLVTSKAFAKDNDLEILAEVGQSGVAGVDPTTMGIGPVPAVEDMLERAGRTIDDYGLVELNEAFASQVIASAEQLGIDHDILNVNGGAIAIGHPLGASGARLPVTLIHEMHKRGVDRGIATECVGFGQGAAIEFALPE